MAEQRDLFATPRIAGLTYADELVTSAEEATLIAAIDATPLAPFRYQGYEGKRLTATFGWRYDFDDASFSEADPLPAWLLPLREKAARFAKLPPDAFPHALLIRYDVGAAIGWHRDRPQFDQVLGISLGDAATMRFRRRHGRAFDRASVQLAPRSVYHLTGEARHLWEHSIAPMEVTRWSITFRSLSAQTNR